MISILESNAHDAYESALIRMKMSSYQEDSRNGKVLSLATPMVVEIMEPQKRVIACPTRNANPFFHVMEFVWMMAGRRDAEFISRFNSRMSDYAEDDGLYDGAYGYRWRRHFNADQLPYVIGLLKEDPTTRRAVLTMWDPTIDLMGGQSRDHPCNTHIYFRIQADSDSLDMTVLNRSNDLIWGMFGANIVHMTLLHELVARAVGCLQGTYTVFTNNAHLYPDAPNVDKILMVTTTGNIYRHPTLARSMPVLGSSETYHDFVTACSQFCDVPEIPTGVKWVDKVAAPMYDAYFKPKDLPQLAIRELSNRCAAEDWRRAACDWVARNRRHK